MGRLKGHFSTTANGIKTYEIYEASPHILYKIGALLRDNFGYEAKPLVDGIDVFYLDCVKENSQITIGWDVYSSCFIMPLAETPTSDEIIQEIGTFLESQLETLDYFYDDSNVPVLPENME